MVLSHQGHYYPNINIREVRAFVNWFFVTNLSEQEFASKWLTVIASSTNCSLNSISPLTKGKKWLATLAGLSYFADHREEMLATLAEFC